MAACLMVFVLAACGGNFEMAMSSAAEPETEVSFEPVLESPNPSEEETPVPEETGTKGLVV